MLELISEDFYNTLVDHVSPEDSELLFSSAKVCAYL